MSLQGSLSQLGLADVLQNALAGREGCLVLRRGTERAVLHVSGDGIRLLEPHVVDPGALLDGFVYRGLLTKEVLDQAVKRHGDGEAAVSALVRTGALDESEVRRLLAGAAEDAVLDLLTWTEGDFRFTDGEPCPEESGLAAKVCVDPGGVLLRAAQRVDERAAIADALGLHAHLFRTVQGAPLPEDDADGLSHQIHARLDGITLLEEVALLCGTSRFIALRTVFELVRAGAARLAAPTELATVVESRLERGEHEAARNLLLQWAGAAPADVEPLERLVRLAKEMNRPGDVAEAMISLGHLLVHKGEPGAALKVFQDLLARRPGDVQALSGIRMAAEAAGDTQQLAESTLQLAEVALERDEAHRAAQILTAVVNRPDAPLEAHLLRARAFVRMNDRDGIITEAESVSRMLGARLKKREHRSVASFFRDAVASLAPERSDLLRRFRSLSEGNRGKGRRVAIIAALLLVVATGGYMLWPESPASLLEKARAAADAGDRDTALQYVAALAEKYPDAPETGEAFLIQATLVQQTPPPTAPRITQEQRETLNAAFAAAVDGAADLPAEPARSALTDLADLLVPDEMKRFRDEAAKMLEGPLEDALERLARETREQSDAFAFAARIADEGRIETDELRVLVSQLQTFTQQDRADAVRRSIVAVETLLALGPNDRVSAAVTKLERALKILKISREKHAARIDDCRRLLAIRNVEEAYEASREGAPALVAEGRFREAEAYYDALEERIREVEADPVLRSMMSRIRRRRIPDYLADRRAVLQDINEGLAHAAAVELAGDLAGAARQYAAVANKHWQVRFDNVIRLPLRVETVPAGAAVTIGGKPMGTTPVVTHYPWGGSTTITLEAPGCEPATHELRHVEDEPVSELRLALRPRQTWTVPVEPSVTAPPIGIDGDVLVCDRGGRVTLHAASDGDVRWVRKLNSLEGIRSRPLVSGGIVNLPFVDGSLVFLSLREGEPLGEEQIGRPVGDPALLDDVALFATLDGDLVAFRGRDRLFTKRIQSAATAGVLAGHGAFWVGTGRGHLVRVTNEGVLTSLPIGDDRSPIVGMCLTPTGLLVTTGKGNLDAVDPSGRVAWTAPSIGDVVGTPAMAAGVAATVDRRGRVLLFDANDGAPLGQRELRGEPRGGVLGTEDVLLVYLTNGHLWIYDPAQDALRADVGLGGDALFPPAVLGDGHIGIPGPGTSLLVFSLREKPTKED
jgi:outer membrane protein assembly factor BamB/tetratricopeptide (TPR) repeat protein